MKLLTIIVSYNFVPWIDRCLGSLRQSQTPTDVMVLDNASADDTVARIRRDYPEVMLVENHRNLGFGHANNIGMLHAIEHGYDAVLLLNQDAWIAPDALGKLAEASSRHPEYGILSPIHLTGSGNRVEQGFATYSGISDLNQQPAAEVVTVPFVDAAIWYIPVSALRRVGLFEPIFYHYGEDKDMANRMGYHGLYTGYLPACTDATTGSSDSRPESGSCVPKGCTTSPNMPTYVTPCPAPLPSGCWLWARKRL